MHQLLLVLRSGGGVGGVLGFRQAAANLLQELGKR